VVIGYDGDLISDAKVQLDMIIDFETPKHNAWANKELVSTGARAARPLGIVQSEFRPEDVEQMILERYAGE